MKKPTSVNAINSLSAFTVVCTFLALTQPQPAQATTLLVDFQAGGGLVSTAADFWANDNNVDLSASVNTVTSFSGATILGGFTLTQAGGGGVFNTINGAANDNLPILDGYWWTFGGMGSRTLTIDGLAAIPTGEIITLTFYGASDNDTAVASFNPIYGGIDLGTQAAGSVPSSRTTAFSFTSTGADQLSVPWGKTAGGGGAGFNGFSLTTVVPEPSAFALLGLGGLALLGFRRDSSRL
jgi:hypothetical protein